MIYTLTLNPALDLEYQIEQFAFNTVSRSVQTRADCGGKGFNVSRMLRQLGFDSIAMGFVGGKTGERLEQMLKQQSITCDFTWIDGETRTNTSCFASETGQHIKVNDAGPLVTQDELQSLLAKVRTHLTRGDWWVLAGSLPKGVPNNFYAQLVAEIEAAGAHAILDTSGEALTLGCKAGPTLIKPNDVEALQLIGLDAQDVDNSYDWVSQVLQLGPKNLVISLGKDGALFATNETIEKVGSPSIVEQNPIGAGDSMVAGLVAQLSRKASLAEALTFGIACGAATASKAGTELGTLNDVSELLSQMEREAA